MSLRLRTFGLVVAVAAAPLAAQEPRWDPDSWTAEGWSVTPLDEDLPSGERMLQQQLDSQVIEMVPREDPLVMRPVRRQPATDTAPRTETAPAGAVLRGLDRLSGAIVDIVLAPGETGRVGRLQVTLQECRYPADNPASDAFAYLRIVDPGAELELFAGWMLASSPALNPLDDPRYDLWVMRCNSA